MISKKISILAITVVLAASAHIIFSINEARHIMVLDQRKEIANNGFEHFDTTNLVFPYQIRELRSAISEYYNTQPAGIIINRTSEEGPDKPAFDYDTVGGERDEMYIEVKIPAKHKIGFTGKTLPGSGKSTPDVEFTFE